MKTKKAESPRKRSDRCQAYTWVITVTADQVELLARIMATEYSIWARCCRAFRPMALCAFSHGLDALHEGAVERKADPESPVFAKQLKGFQPGTTKLTLTEEQTVIATFLTKLYPKYGHAKEFQEKAEQIMDLGIAMLAERIEWEGNYEAEHFPKKPEAAPAPPAPPREPRVRWPKRVDAKPAPCADDLPDLFGEDSVGVAK